MAETKTAVGKVTVTGGKYFVTVNRKKHPLPVGTLIDPKQARKLAGKEVVAYLSSKPKSARVVEPYRTRLSNINRSGAMSRYGL